MLSDGALTTIATVEAELGLSSGEADSLLTRYINAASEAITTLIGRPLHYEAGIEDRVPGYGTRRLILPRRPVESVTSVEYDDTDTSYTIGAEQYFLEQPEAGILYFNALGLGGAFNTGARVGINGEPVSGSQGWFFVVTYTGGWVTPEQAANDGSLTRTLPYDLEEACVACAVLQYRERGRNQNVSGRKNTEASITYAGPGSARTISTLPIVRAVVASYGEKWGVR